MSMDHQPQGDKKEFSFNYLRTSSGIKDSTPTDIKDSSFCSTASLMNHLIEQTVRPKVHHEEQEELVLDKKFSGISRTDSMNFKKEELIIANDDSKSEPQTPFL